MIKTRRELRDVQSALRRDIDSLHTWLKFFNIAAMAPLIPISSAVTGRRSMS